MIGCCIALPNLIGEYCYTMIRHLRELKGMTDAKVVLKVRSIEVDPIRIVLSPCYHLYVHSRKN